MKTLPVNSTDQSPLIASEILKGTRDFVFASEHHKLAHTIVTPGDKPITFKAHPGAIVELAMDGWAFQLSHDLNFIGGCEPLKILGGHKGLKLATGVAGTPRVSFDRVDCDVETSIQNVGTAGATNSVFRAATMWKNAKIETCNFLSDCYIGGNTQFTNNSMEARLVANNETGGLNKAKIHRVRWDSWLRVHNAMESVLFEDCDVLESELSELEFRGGCTTLLHWGVNVPNSACKCHGNVFQDITSDGPTAIGIRFKGGDVDGNLFRNISIHRAMYPILLEEGCKSNLLECISIVDCVPSVMQGGWEPWNWDAITRKSKRFAIEDHGSDTRYGEIHAEGLRGIELTNRPDRIKQPIQN